MIKSSFVIFILLIYICTSSLFSKEIENIKKIDSTEFYYANTKRYSLSGELPNLETKINVPYFIGITATTAAFMVSQHIYQSNTIWKDKAEFKIIEDGQYALYADKAGHIFGSYIMSYAYTEFLSSAGISWELSNILGASIGLTYQTYIEVLDGYGSNFGFSPSDFYADIFDAIG